MFIKNVKKTALAEGGSTLIEVLIATLVVGLILTAVASVMTISVKNTAQLRYQASATSRSQTALESFRRERDFLGWEAFAQKLQTGTYCVNIPPLTSAQFISLPSNACTGGVVEIGSEFRTEAEVAQSTDQIRVEMVTRWTDGVRAREERLTQIFRKFQ